jgi:hypothetical protein
MSSSALSFRKSSCRVFVALLLFSCVAITLQAAADPVHTPDSGSVPRVDTLKKFRDLQDYMQLVQHALDNHEPMPKPPETDWGMKSKKKSRP